MRTFRSVTILALVALLGALLITKDQTAPAALERDAGSFKPIAPEDIAVFWPLGSDSGAKPGNPLNQSFGVSKRGGFDAWLSQWIRPIYERGFRRLIIHNPLGNDPRSRNMDIDQVYDAYEQGRGWNVAEFNAVLARIGREMPGLEVIVYIGTNNEDTTGALNEGRSRDHLIRSASLFLFTGVLDHEHVTVAFDAATNYADDSPERHLVDMVRAYKRRQGHDVYVEPLPTRQWQRDYPWIALERYYARKGPRPAQPEGIRIFNTPGDFKAWNNDAWAWLADCVQRGHTPALGWDMGKGGKSPWTGMNAADIARRANAQASRPTGRP